MCMVEKQEKEIKNRMKQMLSKMKPNKSYQQGFIDVKGSIDAQAFARLLLEGEIEFDGSGKQFVKLKNK